MVQTLILSLKQTQAPKDVMVADHCYEVLSSSIGREIDIIVASCLFLSSVKPGHFGRQIVNNKAIEPGGLN